MRQQKQIQDGAFGNSGSVVLGDSSFQEKEEVWSSGTT
jgi:hypothetical protein